MILSLKPNKYRFSSSLGWDQSVDGKGFDDPMPIVKELREQGFEFIPIGYGPYANFTQLQVQFFQI